jgi:vacuolar-type H+-ATPase subunit D/Vma8
MAVDNFEDLFLSEEDKAKKRAAAEAAAQKKKLEESYFDEIPSIDKEEPKKNILDDTLSKLKSQFNIDDEMLENLNEKKNKFTADFKERFKDVDEKAEGFNQKADEAANSAMDFFFDAGKKAKEKATDLFEKGKSYAEELEEKMRIKDEAAEEKLKNPKHKASDSLLGGFDSFFDKAKDLADRLDKKVEDRYNKEGEIKLTKAELEIKKSDEPSRIYGFEDLDGDGNPLIDDAIIEE